MKAIILPAYNLNIIRAMLSLRIEEKDIPKPGSNQVLIKIEAAPCNPSDIAFIRGMYNIKKTLPSGSKTILYGGLSGQPVSDISTLEIIFKDKTLTGFNLNEWVREIGKKRFNEISLILQNKIINGEIRTEIQGRFKLEDVVKAIRQYITNMSKGKILFKP